MVRTRWGFLVALALAGCRIHFDLLGEAGDAAPADSIEDTVVVDVAVDTLVLPPTTATYEGADLLTNNASVYTFPDLSIGTASADRVLALVVLSNSPDDFTSVTVGGTAAIRAVMYNPAGGSAVSAIYYLPFPTGTLADIVVTTSAGGATRCAVGIFAVRTQLQTSPTGVSGATSWVGVGSTQVPRLANGVGIWIGQRDNNLAFVPTIDGTALGATAAGFFGAANFYWAYGGVVSQSDGTSMYGADFGADNGVVIAAYFR